MGRLSIAGESVRRLLMSLPIVIRVGVERLRGLRLRDCTQQQGHQGAAWTRG